MAKTPIVFCLFCGFVCVMLCVNAVPYEYFQMVQKWPPATCSGVGVMCRNTPPNMFTIHGLWPSNYSLDSAHLVCSGPPFQLAQISALSEDLNTYWPDVITQIDKWFWRYQWKKHGACSDPPLNQLQYFQSTLTIRKTYDLLAILNAAGLGPSATEVRKYQDIERAIESATGKKPALRCNTNAQTRKSQLHEIILCIDHDGATLIHCTDFAAITCSTEFVWLDNQPTTLSFGAFIEEVKNYLVNESSIGKYLFVFVPTFLAYLLRKRFYRSPRPTDVSEKQD